MTIGRGGSGRILAGKSLTGLPSVGGPPAVLGAQATPRRDLVGGLQRRSAGDYGEPESPSGKWAAAAVLTWYQDSMWHCDPPYGTGKVHTTDGLYWILLPVTLCIRGAFTCQSSCCLAFVRKHRNHMCPHEFRFLTEVRCFACSGVTFTCPPDTRFDVPPSIPSVFQQLTELEQHLPIWTWTEPNVQRRCRTHLEA